MDVRMNVMDYKKFGYKDYMHMGTQHMGLSCFRASLSLYSHISCSKHRHDTSLTGLQFFDPFCLVRQKFGGNQF